MGTRLFIGTAGTGKTEALYREMREAAENGKDCLFFVPDQSSFETERRLYRAAGARNISRITVTSFSRCARRILTEYRLTKPYADDAVKLITMRRAVDGLSDGLTYFGAQAPKKSFPAYALKAVASFKNAGADPAALRETLAGKITSGALFEKLSDLTMIYAEYDRLLTGELDDKLDDVSRAALSAESGGWFKGKNVFIDSFDSFSGTQRRLLAVIAAEAESLTVCLTTDAEESRQRRFFCINKTIEQIKALDPAAKAVLFTERFRQKKMDGEPLKIARAMTPYAEADYIAAEISRLAGEENARWRDVLVLSSERRRAEAVRLALKKYRVPCFFDFPEPLTNKPAVALIPTLLKATSLETDDLLRFIRSGFARINVGEKTRPLKAYESAKLEKAAAAFGLKKADWERPFSEPQLQKLEPLRAELCGGLSDLGEALSAAPDGREMTETLVRYLMEKQDYKSTLLARTKSGGGEGSDVFSSDKSLSDEYNRIWEDLTCVFDSLAFCLGGKKMTVEEYISTLEAVLSGMTVASPPKTLDCVTVGDLERTRKAAVKYVFICGMCEGVVPRKTAPNANFTSAEQETLEESGLEIGGTRLFRYGKELFFAYRALSSAEKRLYLTYSCQSFSGAAAEPSYILKMTGEEAFDAEKLPLDFYVRTPESAAACLSAKLGTAAAPALKKAAGDGDFTLRVEAAAAAADGDGYDFSLAPDTAAELFSSREYSATKLQSAFECAFMHFCKYGLGLFDEEPQSADSPITVGNIVHATLREVMSEKCVFADISETEKPVRAALENQRSELSRTGAGEAEIAALLDFLAPRIQKLLMQTSGEFAATGFRPRYFERKVTYRLGDISVGGTADRIDVAEIDGVNYARICDYKTGGKAVSAEALGKGLDLQPFLYLFAYCDESGDVPAAAGYAQAGREKPVRYNATAAFDERLQLKGWYESHRQSLSLVGDQRELDLALGSYNAELCEKTGSPRMKFVKLVDLETSSADELRHMIDEELILPKVERLRAGEIPAKPAANGKNLPCAFCRFRFFCNNRNGIFTLKPSVGDDGE